MNILLTSVGRRSYLAEYFKEAIGGDGVVCVANSSLSPGFYAADRAVKTPLIYDQDYIPFLKKYCMENQIELLVPLFDVDLPVLSVHKEEFERIGTTVVVADSKTVEICNDKWKTYQFLNRNGFHSPRTYITLESARQALEMELISYPVMIKPRWGMGSLGIYQADNRMELEVFYKKIYKDIEESYMKFESKQNPDACVIIQEKLQGREYGLDVICDLKGEYQNTVSKCKEGMRSGETDSAMTVYVTALERLGMEIAGHLRHCGNLDMDVFLSDGRFYVLEMNARFGGGYPFSHMAGVNLPQAIVNWKMGKPVDKKMLTPTLGVRSYKDIRMRISDAESTIGDTIL